MTMGRHWGSLASAGAVGTDWPAYTADGKKVCHALHMPVLESDRSAAGAR